MHMDGSDMAVIYWDLKSKHAFALVSEDAYTEGLEEDLRRGEYAPMPWDVKFLRGWIGTLLVDGEHEDSFIHQYFHVDAPPLVGDERGYTPIDLETLLVELRTRGHQPVPREIFESYIEDLADLSSSHDEY